MTAGNDRINAAAAQLWAAERDRAPIAPLTVAYPGLDVANAYAIQRVNLHRRLVTGATLVGHKIGLTSKPMQTLLGVDAPDFGFILDDMVVKTDRVAVERFCAPRVEPEVAFLLHAPLRGPRISPDDVRAATAAVAVALEVVDSRIADWKLT
ncbi:MAG TPA: 2-keto-4-pentenoate hydratase, partial [Mycobacterium sp.]